MPTNSQSVIYTRQHTVRVSFAHDRGDPDERIVTIRVAIDGDILCLKVHDDCDATFNYTATINASAYEKIKTEQSLDIDFGEFKTQVMELLKQCLNNKMLLRLETSDTTCRMVFYEKSKLKSLIFLIVDLKPTDYTVVVGELSEVIAHLKRANKNLETQLNETKKHLREYTLEVDSLKENESGLRVAFRESLGQVEHHFTSEASAFERAITRRLHEVNMRTHRVATKIEQTRKELRSKDELIGRLSRTLAAERCETDKTNQIVYDYKMRVDSLQRAKEETDQECTRLKQSLKSMEQMLNDLETKCTEQASDLEKAAIVIVQKQKSHDEIARDLVQANNMIVNFNQHYERALKELDDRKSREADTMGELAQCRQRFERITQEFEDYRRIHNEEELAGLKTEVAVSRSKISELEKSNREISKLNALLTRRLSEGGFYNGK